MIGNRTVFRLAATAACANFWNAPYPTLAGPHIYESRIEPVEDVDAKRLFPIAVFYTDYDRDYLLRDGMKTKPRLLTLTIELLVVGMKQVKDAETFTLETPQTDSELELVLDAFEAQIYESLYGVGSAAQAFMYLQSDSEQSVSRRGATVEGGLRLAARQLTIESTVSRDPTTGEIPQEIAEFLTELEATPAYAEKAIYVREILNKASSMSADWQKMRAMGIGDKAAGLLGYNRSPSGLLPADVVWHGPDPLA